MQPSANPLDAAPPRLRPIEPRDDVAIAAIIRRVMPEFGADGPGFAIHDPEVDAMSRAYAAPNALYLVVEQDGVVVGGAGIAPLRGGSSGVCELQKMYFLPHARGRGTGRALVARLLQRARELGYRSCYLETLTGMDAALRLYEKLGFKRRACALGATGHSSCDQWFELDLCGEGARCADAPLGARSADAARGDAASGDCASRPERGGCTRTPPQ